jgi:hypothetical protein
MILKTFGAITQVPSTKLSPNYTLMLLGIKDPVKTLNYTNFWNVRDSIPPYVIPEQPQSTISQLQHSLDYCIPRIRRTREHQVYTIILHSMIIKQEAI